MLRIRASKTTLHVLTGVAVALFIGCAFIYFNRSATLDRMDRRLQKAQGTLADSQQVMRQLDDVQSNYRLAQAKLGALENGVTSKAYIPTLLRQLEELGKENNLHVVAVRPKAPDASANAPKGAPVPSKPGKDAVPYDKIDVDIEVNGSYKSAVHFLQALTSFPKIIAVNNVQITPLVDDKKAGLAPLSVHFNTTAFIMKVDADAVKTEEARSPETQPSRT